MDKTSESETEMYTFSTGNEQENGFFIVISFYHSSSGYGTVVAALFSETYLNDATVASRLVISMPKELAQQFGMILVGFLGL